MDKNLSKDEVSTSNTKLNDDEKLPSYFHCPYCEYDSRKEVFDEHFFNFTSEESSWDSEIPF